MIIKDIPSGALTCFIDETEYGIVSLEDHAITVRMAERPEYCEISMSFSYYCFKEAEYHEIKIQHAKIISDYFLDFSYQVRIEIKDVSYGKMLIFVVNQYQNYIRLKCESYDNSFSESLTGYPASQDDIFEEDYNSWRNTRLIQYEKSGFWESTVQSGTVTFAFCLQMPQEYDLYLSDNMNRILPEFVMKRASRVYIGNEYCPLLLPQREILWKLLFFSASRGYEVTFLFPVLQESWIPYLEEYISELYDWCISHRMKIEVVLNDFGYFPFIENRKDAFIPCMGTLLNKRRKDPRYIYKSGFDAQKARLEENALNNEKWMRFLENQGIERFEYETCGYRMKIASKRSSLHFPLYQTNTSQHCPLYALAAEGNRGRQKEIRNCSHLCRQFVIMYPEHLSLIGKMNSIFACDMWLMNNPDVLREYIEQGVDRFVWNMI